MTSVTVSPIVGKLFINDTIDRSKFSIFNQRRRMQMHDRDVTFFLNARFDFKNLVWKSGYFKIRDENWAVTDVNEYHSTKYKYPMLGKRYRESFACFRTKLIGQ